MVAAQLFEVTVAADGTKLSSKRVSKLSRRYHRHKKQLRQSATRVEARDAKSKALVTERAIAKSDRHVEKYGDVDHQLKKVRLSGMQAHAEKIMVDTISTQIKNLKENADVYKSVHGEKTYNELLVSLISKMTGTMNKKGTMPSSSRSEDNDEDE